MSPHKLHSNSFIVWGRAALCCNLPHQNHSYPFQSTDKFARAVCASLSYDSSNLLWNLLSRHKFNKLSDLFQFHHLDTCSPKSNKSLAGYLQNSHSTFVTVKISCSWEENSPAILSENMDLRIGN
jgi:hypothetical protein